MGAHNFYDEAEGNSPREAYQNAVEQAQHEYGHDPYNGTISTTNGFRMVTKKPGQTMEQLEDEWLDKLEKWGKCACVDLGGKRYAFFGWAAS
jgi:hypothetical protein